MSGSIGGKLVRSPSTATFSQPWLVGTDFPATLTQASASAGVVFLGLLQPREEGAPEYLAALEEMIDPLGTVIFVASARDMTLKG